MPVKVSKKRIDAVLQATADTMGVEGHAYAIDEHFECIASGTWKFIPENGFEWTLKAHRDGAVVEVVLRGKGDNFMRFLYVSRGVKVFERFTDLGMLSTK